MSEVTISRVRLISIDGGKLGRVYKENFFRSKREAALFMKSRIKEDNSKEEILNRNDCYARKFKEDPESVDGTVGYCCWLYGYMYTLDSFTV